MDPRDVAAVKAASATGVTVVLATGRMFKSSLRYAEPLGLRGPIINYQGAVVREIASGEVWYRCELTVPMQQRVLAFAEPRDWHVNAYVDERVYTARALAMVADRLGVAREEVAAIGDNLNDQDMVSWAGLGVAMGNAPEALKGAAGYVTGRIGEAGVAQVIDQFVIGSNELPLRA